MISERVTMSFESRLLIVGYVLHKFIVGWDHTECTKVFRYFMHHQKPIKESVILLDMCLNYYFQCN